MLGKRFKILDTFYIRQDTLLAVENGYQCFEVGDIIKNELGENFSIAGISRPDLSQIKGENSNVILLIKGKHQFVSNQLIFLNKL